MAVARDYDAEAAELLRPLVPGGTIEYSYGRISAFGLRVKGSPWLDRGTMFTLCNHTLVVGLAVRRPRGRLAAKRWVRDELWRRRMARDAR